MHENNTTTMRLPTAAHESAATIAVPKCDALTEILRGGAQRLLRQAIDAEVTDWIERHAGLTDNRDRQQVVRNGHHPARTLVTGAGPVEVKQPRVLDRRIVGQDQDSQDVDAAGRPVMRFSSKILPPYLRKTKAIEELIPWLYLKGISTGDFGEALQALVGSQAAGLSATTITRLMVAWQDEHKDWSRRSLAGKQYVYVWADGILDRDPLYPMAFRNLLQEAGVKSVRFPPRSPNLNAYAERFVRTVKECCIRRMIFFGENSLRSAITEFLEHYHHERNHQGLQNRLIDPLAEVGSVDGAVACRERLGGVLRYYYRDAA